MIIYLMLSVHQEIVYTISITPNPQRGLLQDLAPFKGLGVNTDSFIPSTKVNYLPPFLFQ
jgi:hypothetical protein